MNPRIREVVKYNKINHECTANQLCNSIIYKGQVLIEAKWPRGLTKLHPR